MCLNPKIIFLSNILGNNLHNILNYLIVKYISINPIKIILNNSAGITY